MTERCQHTVTVDGGPIQQCVATGHGEQESPVAHETRSGVKWQTLFVHPPVRKSLVSRADMAPPRNSFTEYEQRHRDAAAPSIKGARALLDAALTLDAANLEPVGLSWSLGRAGGLVVHMDGPDRVRRAAAVLFGNADVERYRYDPDHPTLLTYRSEVDGAQVQVYGANDRSVLGR